MEERRGFARRREAGEDGLQEEREERGGEAEEREGRGDFDGGQVLRGEVGRGGRAGRRRWRSARRSRSLGERREAICVRAQGSLCE